MTPNPRRLEQTLAATLARRESASQLRRLTSFPPDHVDFSSNAYLSLSNIPEIRQGFLSSLQSTETSLPPLLGSGGSRLLDGNSPFAEAIESQVARFHKAPSGLLFNSGFDANVGLFSCLPQPGDIIVHDELIHASVHHGMKLSRAKKRVAFKHNCVESADHNSDGELGLKSLDTLLGELVGDQRSPGVAEGSTSVFVAVEGVYSMDGDVAPLQEIVSCVKRHLPKGNGYIIVDEAHSTGLFGAHGSGLVCELGLEQEVFARLNTFGKAMSASGAIVLCTPITRQYLINYARTIIYTTAMPTSTLTGIKVTYDFLEKGGAEPLRSRLNHLIKYTHRLLHGVCSRPDVPLGLLQINEAAPRSPIIPLFTTSPRSLAKHCQDNKFIVRPVVAPTVPKGSERVRVCIHAKNTKAEIEGLVKVVEDWVQGEILHGSPREHQKPRL